MARRRLSPAEAAANREVKLEQMATHLEGAVEALTSGEDWMRAMAFAAKFRGRSFNNTLLIYVQHAIAHAEGRVAVSAPTYVAGFDQWSKLGRAPMKGQSGYMIYGPVHARYATSNPQDSNSWRRLEPREKPKLGEVVRMKMVGVKPAYVWDVSQTSGDPIPERPMPRLLEGQAPPGLWDGLAVQVETAGFGLTRVPGATVIGGANGITDYTNRVVSVRTDMDEAAQVKTLAHELGHVLMHEPGVDGRSQHRGIIEVEAESVAMMVGSVYGMDTADYTVGYVASWAEAVPDKSPVEVVRETGERVRKTALAILERLPDPGFGDGYPPGLVRDTGPATNREAARAVAARGVDLRRLGTVEPTVAAVAVEAVAVSR